MTQKPVDPARVQRPLPGRGLFGWLGRQVGYVSAAVRHDPLSVAKKTDTDERRDPHHPGLVFRRTITDEVRHDPPRGRLSEPRK